MGVVSPCQVVPSRTSRKVGGKGLPSWPMSKGDARLHYTSTLLFPEGGFWYGPSGSRGQESEVWTSTIQKLGSLGSLGFWGR